MIVGAHARARNEQNPHRDRVPAHLTDDEREKMADVTVKTIDEFDGAF